MKRKILMLVTAFVLMFSGFNVYAQETDKPKLYLYVSPNGNNENSGTLESPFKTIEKARDTIRAIKKETGLSAYKEVVVYLRGGVYYTDKTIELNSLDAGTEECRITYSAFPGEQPVVSSGHYLKPSDFQNVKDKEVLDRLSYGAKKNVRAIDLKKLGITDYGKLSQTGDFIIEREGEQFGMQVFVDDACYDLARWPNRNAEGYSQWVMTNQIIKGLEGYTYRVTSKEISSFTVHDETYERMKTWKTYDDIWLLGSFKWVFFCESLPIVNVDASKKQIDVYGGARGGWENNKPFLFFNVLEELDAPGEYYIDRDKGILYLYPEENFNNGSTVKLSGYCGEFILRVHDNCDYINLNGIDFELSRFHDVQVTESAFINITNCSFDNCGSGGLFVGETVRWNDGGMRVQGYTIKEGVPQVSMDHHDIDVVNCNSINPGAFGLHIAAGLSDTLTPGNVNMLNCYVYGTGRVQNASTAGMSLFGCGNTLKNCLVDHAPYIGIMYGGAELDISHTEFSDLMRDYNDGSPLYTCTSNYTNEIHHNWLHGSPEMTKVYEIKDDLHRFFDTNIFFPYKMGLYTDGTSPGGHFYNNIVEDVIGGIHHYSWGLNCHDNIFNNVLFPFSLSTSFYAKGAADSGKDWWEGNCMDIFKLLKLTDAKVWREKYPEIEKQMEEIDHKVETDYDNFHMPNSIIKDNLVVYGDKIISDYDTYFNFGEKSLFNRYDVTNRTAEWLTEIDNPLKNLEIGGGVYENNITTTNDVGFVDYQDKDFTLKEDAEILETHPGLANIKMEEIGLMYDNLDERILNAAVFSANSSKAIVNGKEKMLVNGNPEIETLASNGTALIPVSFAKECFGESITDKEDGNISLSEIAEKTGKKLFVSEEGLYVLYEGKELFTESEYDKRLLTVLSAIMK